MKKKLRKLVIICISCIFVVGLGYLVYDQVSQHNYLPKEAIGVARTELEFSDIDFKEKVDFASKMLGYQAHLTDIEGTQVQNSSTTFYWYIKQGANVIQEMPIDGVLRQSNRGRIGRYTLSTGEVWSPLTPTFEKQGYFLEGKITYTESLWPDWPEVAFSNNREQDWIDWPAPKQTGPNITDAALEEMGIYRIDGTD